MPRPHQPPRRIVHLAARLLLIGAIFAAVSGGAASNAQIASLAAPANAQQRSDASSSPANASSWIRPQKTGDPLIWGRRDGIVFGLPSEGGLRGPRGLIRVGVPSPETGKPELLNYIAVEPVVLGPGTRGSRMAFSELEASQLDPGKRGKRLWADLDSHNPGGGLAGKLETFRTDSKPIERLSVQIDVEHFSANGAHVYVVASIDSDRPNELNLAVYQYRDSPPIEELTLTATMGNYERLRHLWLNHRVLDSRELFGSYTGDDFADAPNYPLSDMLRMCDGDAIVLGTTNESTPSSFPGTPSNHWHYPLPKLTQYWRVAAHDIQPDLRVRVNGRRVYWASHDVVPGGIAFENFEVRERYVPGQTFTFGVTAKDPWLFDPPIPGVEKPDSHGTQHE